MRLNRIIDPPSWLRPEPSIYRFIDLSIYSYINGTARNSSDDAQPWTDGRTSCCRRVITRKSLMCTRSGSEARVRGEVYGVRRWRSVEKYSPIGTRNYKLLESGSGRTSDSRAFFTGRCSRDGLKYTLRAYNRHTGPLHGAVMEISYRKVGWTPCSRLTLRLKIVCARTHRRRDRACVCARERKVEEKKKERKKNIQMIPGRVAGLTFSSWARSIYQERGDARIASLARETWHEIPKPERKRQSLE